jgi:hypothetical protein
VIYFLVPVIDVDNVVDPLDVLQAGDVYRYDNKSDITLGARYAVISKLTYITNQLGGEGKFYLKLYKNLFCAH